MKYNIRVKIDKESNDIIYYNDKINNIKFKESLFDFDIKYKNLNTGEKAIITLRNQLRDKLDRHGIKFTRYYGPISGTSILDRLTRKEIILRGCYKKINDFCAVDNCGDHYVAYTVYNSALIKYYINNTISVDAIYDEIINKGKHIYREDHYFRTEVVNNRLVGSKLSYRKELKFSSKILKNGELETILVTTIECKYNIDETSMNIFISYTFDKDKNKKVSFEANNSTAKFYISQSSVSSNYIIDCLNIDNPDIDDYLIIKANSNKMESNDVMRIPIPKNSFIAVSENSKKKYSDIYIYVDQMDI